MKFITFILIYAGIFLFNVNGQVIIGPDEVDVDSAAVYYHTLGPGSPGVGRYYWVVDTENIIDEDEEQIELIWNTAGFFKVQLWYELFNPQQDSLMEEKPVVAGSPAMFEYTYDPSGNRIGRDIIYYQSQGGKKSSKISEPKVHKMEEDGLKVYPNPVEEVLYVEFPPHDGIMQGGEICLFDSMGRKILHKKTDANINTLDFSGLKSGYYILKIFYNGKWKEWRVIKS